jgi:hypothetical protein
MTMKLVRVSMLLALAACTAEVPEIGSTTQALEVVEFERYESCPFTTAVSPLPGEEGEWAAVELDPGANVAVSEVHYTLSGLDSDIEDIHCNTGLAHAVKVFVSSAGAPDDEPFFQYGKVIPASAIDLPTREITLTLPHDIAVLPGQRLFLAVKMVWPPGEESLCWRACRFPASAGVGTDYWSPTLSSPFDWTPLSAFGLHDQYKAGGVGYEFDAGSCASTFFDAAPGCSVWGGSPILHGACPNAGPGWTKSLVGTQCRYTWTRGGEPELCTLPTRPAAAGIGPTAPYQWLHQACTRPAY